MNKTDWGTYGVWVWRSGLPAESIHLRFVGGVNTNLVPSFNSTLSAQPGIGKTAEVYGQECPGRGQLDEEAGLVPSAETQEGVSGKSKNYHLTPILCESPTEASRFK